MPECPRKDANINEGIQTLGPLVKSLLHLLGVYWRGRFPQLGRRISGNTANFASRITQGVDISCRSCR